MAYDFVNRAMDPSARVAVELTLEAAKELSGALAGDSCGGKRRKRPFAQAVRSVLAE